MIENNVISKILKKNIINNYNYFINIKYNLFINKCMENIIGFKKKNYIYFLYVKNLNNYLTNNFNIIRGKRLTFETNKIVRKFV